uniref:CCHC-type domain-containing protein n=1 Tax=Cannabis sativa TaxID=3483 RepID=A0A803P4J3_CANSA
MVPWYCSGGSHVLNIVYILICGKLVGAHAAILEDTVNTDPQASDEEKREGELEALHQNFLDSMSLELEPDFQLNAEKLKGNWKFKTLKPGLWGIYFDLEEDCFEVPENRPWLINGKMLIIQEWPEDGLCNNVDMGKAIFLGPSDRAPWTLSENCQHSYDCCQGFYLDIKRARKEWIQFRYYKLPKICYHCGYLGHDKKVCKRSLALAYPPEGEAVPAFGPWIKAESAIYKCFNTRNQLDCLYMASGVHSIRPKASPSAGNLLGEPVFNPKDKGKNLLGNSNTRMKTTVNPVVEVSPKQPSDNGATRPDANQICEDRLIQDKRPRSVSPSLLHFHLLGKKASDVDNEIIQKYTSCPIPNPRDERVFTSIMANVGPTYKEMIESPHSDLCKSRQPHKHPVPTHFSWPIYASEIGLTEELMGPPPIDKYEPFPTLFNDPVDVSERPKPSKLGEAGEDPDSGKEWRLIATYRTPYNVEKKVFWSSFQDRLINCGLPWGYKYTWQNNRYTRELVRERLDRAIGSFDWVSWYSKVGVRNLPITALDHACILLDTQMFCAKNFIPFKFFEAWTLVDSCKDMVTESWRVVGSDPATTFVENLNKPITGSLVHEEVTIKEKLKEIWQRKEIEWRQKSREVWLSLGDRNSRFFHASKVIRRRRNQILVLQDDFGSPREGRRHFTTIINRYFTKLYYTSMPEISSALDDLFSNRVNSEDNEFFTNILKFEEIRATAFELHPLKAPGPYGFSGCFFRKFLTLVGDNICEVVKKFFRTRVLEKQLNYTLICLIPKVEHPDRIDQFRPISLCNFSYKIIAMILANRLKRVMDELISLVQSAFIPGRWIAESSILTQELVHMTYKRKRRSRDMILECVTSVSYSVLFNGSPLKKFSPQRGLRQGDPLSPFIFLLCQEVLSKLLSSAEHRGLIHGIKIARNAPTISHLMFTDDTILFARGNENEAGELLKCLATYEKCHENFWMVKAKGNDSFMWKSILETREIIKKGSMTLAASGISIDFWHQQWIPWLEVREFNDLMENIRPRRLLVWTLTDISIGSDWNEELKAQEDGTAIEPPFIINAPYDASTMEAETKAVKMALEWATQNSWDHLIPFVRLQIGC